MYLSSQWHLQVGSYLKVRTAAVVAISRSGTWFGSHPGNQVDLGTRLLSCRALRLLNGM